MSTKTRDITFMPSGRSRARGTWALLAVAVCGLLGALDQCFAVPPEAITNDEGITFKVLSEETAETATAGLPEQTPLTCEGNNHNTKEFNNNISMGTPMGGISWVPTISATIRRIEVFTGEDLGPIALAIWSDNAIAGQPGVNLGNTTYFPLGLPNTWQGGNLSPQVTVSAGTQYWVVVDSAGGEQSPVQNCTVGQTYWVSWGGNVTGGASWDFGPFSFQDHCWKFRMFCKAPVPTVSEWGLGALALLLLIGVALKFGRRRAVNRRVCR